MALRIHQYLFRWTQDFGCLQQTVWQYWGRTLATSAPYRYRQQSQLDVFYLAFCSYFYFLVINLAFVPSGCFSNTTNIVKRVIVVGNQFWTQRSSAAGQKL